MKKFILGLIPLIAGIVLLVCGLSTQTPGMALTTYKSLNGASTSGYAMDNRYSSIDEYVGGDAYNFIIGASLISGQVSGAMTQKAIYVTGGVMLICAGLMFMLSGLKKEKPAVVTPPVMAVAETEKAEKPADQAVETVENTEPENTEKAEEPTDAE